MPQEKFQIKVDRPSYDITITIADEGLKKKLREEFNRSQACNGKHYDLEEDGDSFKFTKRSDAPATGGLPFSQVYMDLSDLGTLASAVIAED
ncbi:hypothetical protein K491DRAFT_722209 [Lophiostoma macrostomum CBS 122681]|uniref:Uncharacterized protein n=1 Tax=Lophiostoma macrostomum CBS 122681 TaxID=1314788 RepID=A0A6A6SM05_9PLEO|nr:hypothetical protein K491DRAFT_722209 [Lophiostoma macrostomum CBS 122681]